MLLYVAVPQSCVFFLGKWFLLLGIARSFSLYPVKPKLAQHVRGIFLTMKQLCLMKDFITSLVLDRITSIHHSPYSWFPI